MPPTDTRSQAAFEAALQHIRTTLQSVAERVCVALAATAQSASARVLERDLCNAALVALRRQAAVFQRTFAQVLQDKLAEELQPRIDSSRMLATANWQTLSLVADEEIEERMFADRIGQTIAHACDAELRELSPYLHSLLPGGKAELERNPLRAEMLAAPLCRAIEAVTREAAERQLLAREFGQAMAKAMPACYAHILGDLQARGIRPAVLTARSVDGPGTGGGNSGYATFDGRSTGSRSDFGPPTEGHSRTGTGVSTPSGPPLDRGNPGQRTGGHAGGRHVDSIGGSQAEAQLMSLLRRLSAAVGPAGDTAGEVEASRSMSMSTGTEPGARSPLRRRSGSPSPGFAPTTVSDVGNGTGTGTGIGIGATSRSGALDTGPTGRRSGHGEGVGVGVGVGGSSGLGDVDSVGEMMAVNLIRAHREELLQASTGQLDHMVIDVVGSLFDQILSDTRVPPQMARQIARLQLPVLRVALGDRSFFSSRRHPVRRFVNRIASLACAFDEFDDGPGLEFLERVRVLVQEIVDGDFDQIDLYTAQLGELERFIAEQAAGEVQRNGTADTLENKETELRLQQRYLLQLQAALAPMALASWLGDFLTQVWSQALVLAAKREGPGSDRSQRFRRAGRDLVMSVQPKGSPAMRKKFLMQLPPLMKDLGDGLLLVGWPDEAQRQFFARLAAAHAESLRAPPMSELDHNLMAKELEAVFSLALPTVVGPPAAAGGGDDDDSDFAAEPGSTASVASAAPHLEQRFTADEARRIGLVDESAIDWSRTVDIDLGAEPQAWSTTNGDAVLPGSSGPVSLQEVDLPLDLLPAVGSGRLATGDDASAGAQADAADAAPPSHGPRLMEHVKLGFAYQMNLKDGWQKVRLTHVSPGRNFFVFSRGRRHQQSLSMTARMLARMCETGRMRAVESAYLMERATQRARKQLAAMRPATGSGAPA